jgi:hypothetical protein
MEVVLAATDPAYSTLCAVEDQFLNAIVVPEVAILAEVGPEAGPTRFAILSRSLPMLTLLADHFRDLCAVDLV